MLKKILLGVLITFTYNLSNVNAASFKNNKINLYYNEQNNNWFIQVKNNTLITISIDQNNYIANISNGCEKSLKLCNILGNSVINKQMFYTLFQAGENNSLRLSNRFADLIKDNKILIPNSCLSAYDALVACYMIIMMNSLLNNEIKELKIDSQYYNTNQLYDIITELIEKQYKNIKCKTEVSNINGYKIFKLLKEEFNINNKFNPKINTHRILVKKIKHHNNNIQVYQNKKQILNSSNSLDNSTQSESKQTAQKPINEVQGVNNIEISERNRPENIIENRDNIILQDIPKQPHKIQNSVDKFTINAQEKPYNIPKQQDSINLSGKERAENINQKVDKIIINAKEKTDNILEQKDSINLSGKERVENIYQRVDEIVMNAKEKPKNSIEKQNNIELLPQEILDNDQEQLIKYIKDNKIKSTNELLQKLGIDKNNNSNIINRVKNVEIKGKTKQSHSEIQTNINNFEIKATEKLQNQIQNNVNHFTINRQDNKNNDSIYNKNYKKLDDEKSGFDMFLESIRKEHAKALIQYEIFINYIKNKTDKKILEYATKTIAEIRWNNQLLASDLNGISRYELQKNVQQQVKQTREDIENYIKINNENINKINAIVNNIQNNNKNSNSSNNTDKNIQLHKKAAVNTNINSERKNNKINNIFANQDNNDLNNNNKLENSNNILKVSNKKINPNIINDNNEIITSNTSSNNDMKILNNMIFNSPRTQIENPEKLKVIFGNFELFGTMKAEIGKQIHILTNNNLHLLLDNNNNESITLYNKNNNEDNNLNIKILQDKYNNIKNTIQVFIKVPNSYTTIEKGLEYIINFFNNNINYPEVINNTNNNMLQKSQELIYNGNNNILQNNQNIINKSEQYIMDKIREIIRNIIQSNRSNQYKTITININLLINNTILPIFMNFDIKKIIEKKQNLDIKNNVKSLPQNNEDLEDKKENNKQDKINYNNNKDNNIVIMDLNRDNNINNNQNNTVLNKKSRLELANEQGNIDGRNNEHPKLNKNSKFSLLNQVYKIGKWLKNNLFTEIQISNDEFNETYN